MLRFVVLLRCGACLSTFRAVVAGRPCPSGGPHAHFPVEGVIEQWGSAHHQPDLIVLGIANTKET